MKEQMTGSEWRGRRAGRLVGALGLLLALVLAAVIVLPAYAQDDDDLPPRLPHYFAGTASSSNGPVPEGTAVEAWVEGAKKADTSVTAQGTYDFLVPGDYDDDDKMISFTVAGVQASQTYPWVSGCVTLNFDLTIAEVPNGNPFPFPLPCFVATAAYGTGTAEEIDLLREFRDVVLLTTDLGTELVSLYYQISPAIAEVISQHELLRTAVRAGFVDPITAILDRSHSLWTETYE